MDSSDYLINLGKLVTNLHGLEFTLRAFLLKCHEGQEPPVDPSSLIASAQVPINSFTNYDSLGRLMNKFNDIVRSRHPDCCLDTRVVEVRDMLAHGRVASTKPEFPLQLIKFGKPVNGLVPVEDIALMDSRWLSSNVNLVLEQIKKVIEADKRYHQNVIDWD